MDRVDITTGTLGKALGGASGGYTSARKEIIDILRQRSRPYLFSNSVAPPVVAGSIKAIELARRGEQRARLWDNTRYFRERLEAEGFDVLKGEHPIIPIMLYDAKLASEFAAHSRAAGVYVTAFSYPVVPKGQARIRTQMSSAVSQNDIDQAIDVFSQARAALG
jgi:glycine C-acetyltransferase